MGLRAEVGSWSEDSRELAHVPLKEGPSRTGLLGHTLAVVLRLTEGTTGGDRPVCAVSMAQDQGSGLRSTVCGVTRTRPDPPLIVAWTGGRDSKSQHPCLWKGDHDTYLAGPYRSVRSLPRPRAPTNNGEVGMGQKGWGSPRPHGCGRARLVDMVTEFPRAQWWLSRGRPSAVSGGEIPASL